MRSGDIRLVGIFLLAAAGLGWATRPASAATGKPSTAPSAGDSLERLDPPAAEVPPVSIPGAISLFDIGHYQAGFRQDGRSAQWLGLGWSGEHTPTGAVLLPDLHEAGRRAAFVHVPWRNGGGDFYLEYRLQLPRSPALRLQTAVTLRPDAVGKSDGVDLQILVNGAERLRLQNASSEWKEGAVDLAPFAGQAVHLRLRLSPGPKRNTAFDWALLAEPRLVALEPVPAGAGAGPLPELPSGDLRQRLTELRRRFGTSDPAAAVNRTDQGARPSTTGRYRNTVVAAQGAFLLRHEGDHGRLTYRIEPGDAWPAALTWEYRDRTGAAAGGGPALAGAALLGPDGTPAQTRLIAAELAGDVVVVRHEVAGAGGPIRIETRFTMAGKSLGIQVAQGGGPGRLASVRFGDLPLAIRKVVPVPYLTFGNVRLDVQSGLFTAALLDWTQSSASQLAAAEAHYQPLTDGTRRPVRETLWLTISPHLAEVLPNIPNPPSPVRTELSQRVVADVWGGTFAENRRRIELLASYGAPGLAIIHHNWQHQGYDNAYPDVLPANPGLGGDEELIRLVERARAAGYLFALHENYIDFYPNAPSFDPADIALDSAGKQQTAWFNESTGIQSYALRPDGRVKYAERFSPQIQRRFDTNAAFLDVHSATPPWFHVDFNALAPGAGQLAEVWEKTHRLFASVRQTHGGPLFGEGNNHFFWAGAIDGVEAQVAGGEDAPWWVDFDLLKVHPQMVNHGMGYLERWLKEGYDRPDWWRAIPPQWQLDRYRAMALAFGHAGFIPTQIWQVIDLVPVLALQEIFLMRPIQTRYGASAPVEIRYMASGEALDAGEAMQLGVEPRRLYVRYDSGLELWVNGGDDDWRVEDRTLPPFGFLAQAPGLTASTGRSPEGVVYDLAVEAGYLYLNSRSSGYVWPGDPEYRRRLNPEKTPVDAGLAVTNGSFVLTRGTERGALRLVPIPRRAAFTVRLRLDALLAAVGGAAPAGSASPGKTGGPVTAVDVVAVDADRNEAPHPFTWTDGELTFDTAGGEVQHYVVRVR